MTLTPDSIVVRSRHVAHRAISGQTVLLKVPLSTLHRLNGTGDTIWKCLAAPCAVSDVVTAVCAEFDVPREAAEPDVFEFLQALLDQNLIELGTAA